MILKFKRLCADAKLPCYAHEGDSGMDVFATKHEYISYRTNAIVGTGIAAEIPEGYELQVRPRSGLTKRGVLAAFGTVDSGYRGEIMVNLFNSNFCEDYLVQPGDRIAQLVLAPVVRAQIEEVLELSADTERGTDGFGSTGR